MTATINDSSPEVRSKTTFPVRSGGHQAMHGRDAERQRVRQLLRRAEQGLGGVLLVEGEWGTGRSLLISESGREATAEGFSLAAGTADRLSQMIPFFALLAALNEPFDELTADDRPVPPERRIGQLRELLEQRAATVPVLVCLDDVQWASPATLLALRTLPRKLARYPVAWILARSTSWQDGHTDLLFRFLERDGATRIGLGPLGGDAVAALLADAFGMPPDQRLLALADGAAGNPSLLTELIEGLREENAVKVTSGRALLISAQLPQRIHRVAQQRLDELSKRARHLLQTAAVLGRSFRMGDVAGMLGETAAALLPVVDETVNAGIMAAADDVFSFRHELVWRAVADMIPPSALRALHRQYGEFLLQCGGPAVSAAAHLLQGAHSGDPATLSALDKAAADALLPSPQAAADLTLRALELTSPADPVAVSRSVAAVEALVAAGRLEHGTRIARDVLARPLPALPEARLRCALSSIQCMSGQAGQACGEAQTVLAQPQLPPGLRDRAMIAHLQAVAGSRDNHAAAGIADAILAAPDEHDGQAVTAAQVARAMISWDEGRIGEALELLRDAARQGTGVSPDARHVQPLLALAACLVDLRQLDEADTVLRAADTGTLHGIPSEAVPSILRARIHLAQGRLNDAATEGEAALATAQALAAHAYTSAAHSVLGVIALRRGDLAAAAQHMASRPAPAPHMADVYACETTVIQAQISEARDGAAAIDQIREICTGLPARRRLLLGEPTTAAWLVRTALATGDEDLAARVGHAAAALARGNPGFRALTAAAAHSQGLLDHDSGRLAQAAAQYNDPWARASAAEDLGVLLARQADENQAVHHLNEALRGYGLTGAAIDTARIRHRLRGLGVRQRHWTPSPDRPVTGWESLTETEYTASKLVAQGLNNRQVADRMYVSVHTVAFHLRQIFRKLHISSRVELARIVIEQAQQLNPG